MLFQYFGKNADAPALISSNKVIRYREYGKIVASTAERLKQIEIRKGDRIAIVSRNRLEYPILLLALFRIGVIAVPISHRFPAKQIDSLLRNINCRFGISSKEYSKKEKSSEIRWYDMDSLLPGLKAEESALDDVGMEEGKTSPDQDATIIFTSGTSGKPKAVLHTRGNHYFSAVGSNRNMPFGQGDRWLLSLPLYHVGGLAILFRALINGGAVVIPEADISLTDSMVKYQPTHISLVPTQLYRLLNEHSVIEQLKKMNGILLGGSSIPDNLIEKSLEYQLPIYTSYGSTEMSSQITTTQFGDPPARLLTSGKLLPHRQLKIAADGEILVKGKTLFKGYVQRNEVIAALDDEGWFATGDLGGLDANGYLTVTGRKDNMFISGGENILPEEIEKELCNIAGIKAAVVIPVTDDEFGHRPAAFVEIEGNFPTADFFQKHLKERLPRFKIPDYFFPMSQGNTETWIKPDRLMLKKLAEEIISQKS